MLLTALGASLFLLAQPGTTASARTVDPSTITASLRYGCPDAGLTDGFVEVSLQSSAVPSPGSDNKLVLAVGLAGPGSSTIDGVFLQGGPSLVTIGDGITKVRLAGDIDKADHVFIRQVDQPDILAVPLHSSCRNLKPTNFDLDQPSLEVAKQPCTSGSRANVSVSLYNPNPIGVSIQRLGYDQMEYTVLLVRNDGQLAAGTQLAFDKPSTQSTTVGEDVTTPTPYQVRVIGVDGAVTSTDISLSCAASQPGPPTNTPTNTPPTNTPPTNTPPPPTKTPPTNTPTPPPTKTPPPSNPPTSPAPPVSTPPTASTPPTQPTSAPSASVSSVPIGTSAAPSAPASGGSAQPSSATSQPGSAGAGNPSGPGDGQTSGTDPVLGSPSQGGSHPASGGSPTAVTSPSRVIAGRGPGTPTATPSPSPRSTESGVTRLVVEAPQGLGAVFVFQKNVALVVLVFLAAIAALVGGTVISARRR